jgi:hypothetical protein
MRSAEVRRIWLELLRSIYIRWSDNFSEKIRAAEHLPLEGQNVGWFLSHCGSEGCLLSSKDF